MFVHVSQSAENLKHDVSNPSIGQEFLAIFGHLINVLFEEFKHEEELVVLPNHFAQLHDVRVVQLERRGMSR